jgi:AraC-like DNA-binding protein
VKAQLPYPDAVKSLAGKKILLLESLEAIPMRMWAEGIGQFLDGLKQLHLATAPLVAFVLCEFEEEIRNRLERRKIAQHTGIRPDTPRRARGFHATGSQGNLRLGCNHEIETLCDETRMRLLSDLLALVSSESRVANDLDEIAVYIESHLSERLNLRSIGEGTRRQPIQIVNAFKHLGVTARAHVRERRLLRAFQLIVDGAKVEAALLLVGYPNRTGFFRDFRIRFGFSPGALHGKQRVLDAAKCVTEPRNRPAGIVKRTCGLRHRPVAPARGGSRCQAKDR